MLCRLGPDLTLEPSGPIRPTKPGRCGDESTCGDRHLPAEQAVFDLDAIEDPLIAAIEVSGIGEFDGNLIGPDSAILYM